MSRKSTTRESEKTSAIRRATEPAARTREAVPQTTAAQAFARVLNDSPSVLAPADILALQQSAGNQAVVRLMSQQLSQPATAPQAIQRKPSKEEQSVINKSTTAQPAERQTGLPENLKAGIENLSGMSMSEVKVHHNSPKPAEVQALAYTKGEDIYLGPDEEKHLAHEAWHVVQQKQGRVKPTLQGKGMPINDDAGLEREADENGRRAFTSGPQRDATPLNHQGAPSPHAVIQRMLYERVTDKWKESKTGSGRKGTHPAPTNDAPVGTVFDDDTGRSYTNLDAWRQRPNYNNQLIADDANAVAANHQHTADASDDIVASESADINYIDDSFASAANHTADANAVASKSTAVVGHRD